MPEKKSEKKHLNASSLKKIEGRRSASVDVEEFGGAVKFLELNATKTFEFQQLVSKNEADGKTAVDSAVAKLMLINTMVDDDDKPLFTDETIGAFLDSISAPLMSRLLTQAMALLKPDGLKAAGENPSQASPSASSSSVSV